MRARVAVTRCPSYDPRVLREALSRSLSLIGSLTDVVKPGDRVLLKINHLGEHPPETAIDTHPAFLRAVVDLVREITPDVVVADGLDSPGLGGFEKSGILSACRELDVELLNFKGRPYREIRRAGFETVTSIAVAEAALDADVVITLPKLKTHMLCLMTNAVKNNYGFIPLRLRVNYHCQFPEPDAFSNMVVDVFEALRPHLVLVDAVTALEGTGPSRGGVPKPLGLVVAGRDCVAVDAVCAALMGLEPTEVASTRHAARRGLGEADLARIDVLGESIDAVSSPFRLPSNRMLMDAAITRLPAWVVRAVTGLIRSTREYPNVVRTRCIGCGLCVRHCPVHAVTLVDGKARIDLGRCIACFCCQEFCESDAIGVTHRPVGRVASFVLRLQRRIRRIMNPPAT